MKIDEMIKQLTDIRKETGNCDVFVDTEARKFGCHLIEIRSVSNVGEEAAIEMEVDDFCVIHLY